MEPMDRRMLLAGAGLVGVAALSRAAKAGPLSPPQGPITSTGRTLQQIYDKIARGDAGTPEARIAIQSLPGSPTALHVIDAPGSYYLTGNIFGVPGMCAIEVAADNVEIECDGYNFIGGPGTLSCIRATLPRRCIGVYDGGFVQWQGTCVDLPECKDCLVDECWFDSCTGGGAPASFVVVLGDGGVIYDSDARKCLGGMCVGRRGVIEESTCTECTVSLACFYSVGDCVMEDNFAHDCNGPAFVVVDRGIVLYNRVCRCPSGIDCGAASVVAENDVDITDGATGHGIAIRGGRSCICDNFVCGGGGGGGGIVLFQGADGSLVEGNHVAGAASSAAGTTGGGLIWIQPNVRGCHVISNRVRGVSISSAFYIPPGNSYGPLVVASGDLSLVQHAEHPLANTVC